MNRFLLGVCLLGTPLPGEEKPHWAYVAPGRVEVPAGKHPVDAILEESWRAAGIAPAELAPPRLWVERAAYTLTGLPPNPEHLKRIEADPGETTWRAILEELLASPAYSERWARHWMDVARYADTRGYNFDQDNRYPFAYTYRDWLIEAFAADRPYADFVKLQLAADLLTDRPDHPDLRALGFLTVGLRNGAVETIDDRVDVVTRGFLSSTVACARCHDHKTDPILTQDYYSIYSILENTDEPEEKPVVGAAADEAAFDAYQKAVAEWEEKDRGERQKIVEHLRSPEAVGNYLELAWRAQKEDWNMGMATSEGFKRGRLRPQALMRWRDFLREAAWKESGDARLKAWAQEMDAAADEGARQAAVCRKLADEWLTAAEGSGLAALRGDGRCPLSYEADRVREIMDVEDQNQQRGRMGEWSRLQADHPGSPPRAMSLKDRAQWAPAVVFQRGNPAVRSEPFERHWLSYLGGGTFPEGKSPRLTLAEKIVSPENPLTYRVMANRVWSWHFGAPLVEPGDFGPQTPAPPLQKLLDLLAVRFREEGGSLKALHRLLLTSKAYRLAGEGPEANDRVDQANQWFWKWNRRRVDFESMRDRVLATSGALDLGQRGGRSVRLEDPSSDRRRSLYAFVDRYALPGTFVSFDLPHPDQHSPKRVETTVPQQALYFLNGPMVLRQARELAKHPEFAAIGSVEEKVDWLYRRILQRSPSGAEKRMMVEWVRSADTKDYTPRLAGSWETGHAPETGEPYQELGRFSHFEKDVWKTGPDPATAPIRWLNVSPQGGHVSQGHAMVLRWKAWSAGEARLTAQLRRTQKEGAVLHWRVDGSGKRLSEGRLEPEATVQVESPWMSIREGQWIDLVLTAPEGDTCGNIAWELRVEGRESENAEPELLESFTAGFPRPDRPPPVVATSDPWADLVQVLWASNAFHFID